MTTHCAPACSQVLPVKPQGVWARGLKHERGHVTADSGVSEMGVFRALQPNDIHTIMSLLSGNSPCAFCHSHVGHYQVTVKYHINIHIVVQISPDNIIQGPLIQLVDVTLLLLP